MNLFYIILIAIMSIITVSLLSIKTGGAMFIVGLLSFFSIIIIITMNILLEISSKKNL